ncbi:MAG: aminotransferase class V-fold PLP-dependent enzyme, partial [Rickettsiales bacterium]|nr:aminotransferase class V-fold PLP-dependent enzyme [Rickettsiales bacterium]
QYAAHEKIDVTAWGCDALVFSAHKVGGSTGLGILYLKDPEKWTPDIFGGGAYMASGPARFEAGTLPLIQIASLPVALKEKGRKREKELARRFRERLSVNPKIKWISPGDSAVQSFYVANMHPVDIGALAGARGVCLRAGNCCAKWIFEHLGIPGAVRVSPGAWNTFDEMDKVADILSDIVTE